MVYQNNKYDGEITPEEIGAYMQGEDHQGYTGLHNYLQMSQEFFIILNALVIKKIINFSLSLIKISMHNLFLMDFFFHRNGQIFKIVDKLI